MDALIVFATTEGHTRKVARHLKQSIQRDGHDADLVDCSETQTELDFGRYDAIVLAASVHNKRYQQALYDFVASHHELLKRKPLAFVSVSLAITLAGGEDEAQSYVDDFLKEAKLSVDHVHLAEGAIRYTEYSQSDANTIHLVVFKSQKKMPPRGSNPEYTDWDAIETFAQSFLQSADTASK